MTFSILNLIVLIIGVLFGLFFTPLSEKTITIPKKYQGAFFHNEKDYPLGLVIFFITLIFSLAVTVLSFFQSIGSEISAEMFIGVFRYIWHDNTKHSYSSFVITCIANILILFVDSSCIGLLTKNVLSFIKQKKEKPIEYIYYIPHILVFRFILSIASGLVTAYQTGILEDLLSVDMEYSPDVSVLYYFIWVGYFIRLKSKYVLLNPATYEPTNKETISCANNFANFEEKSNYSPISILNSSSPEFCEAKSSEASVEILSEPQNKESTVEEDSAPTQTTSEPLEQQIGRDKHLLASLQEKRDKLPTERVKQWYEEGNVTEAQYNSVMQKKNALDRQIDEVNERIAFLESFNPTP